MKISDSRRTATHSAPAPGPRAILSSLARQSPDGLITTRAAASAWDVSPAVATSRLHRLVRAGWLARVRRGLFLVLPLDAASAEATTADDPWLVAAAAFSPCYIGGWTSAHHWGLTEQTFRPVFVATAAPVRTTSTTLMGQAFRTVRVPRARVASVPPIWRGASRVAVSDRERTLADGLARPEWVGGVRHLAEMLVTYRRSEHWDPGKLLAALAAHPRGAAYKRLGHLAEAVLGGDPTLVPEAHARRSTGAIRLDPGVRRRGYLSRRWGLWVNVDVAAHGG